MQAKLWSALYIAYVVLASLAAFAAAQRARQRAAGAAPTVPAASSAVPPLAPKVLFGWIALSALASYELVAVTNHLTQNIPSMPMMWVLPLCAYLLTLTLCFDGNRWYRPRPFRVAALLAVATMCWMLDDERFVHQIVLQASVFTVNWPEAGHLRSS